MTSSIIAYFLFAPPFMFIHGGGSGFRRSRPSRGAKSPALFLCRPAQLGGGSAADPDAFLRGGVNLGGRKVE